MAKKNEEEEVSFAGMLLKLLEDQTTKKTQDQNRTKALAGGVNRDLARMAEKKAQEDAVRQAILGQARATGSLGPSAGQPASNTPTGAPAQPAQNTLASNAPQGTPPSNGAPSNAPPGPPQGAQGQVPPNTPKPNPVVQATNPGNSPLGRAGGLPAPQAAPGLPTRPGTQVQQNATPNVEVMGKPAIDVPFEEVRNLQGGQNRPALQGPTPQEAVQKGPAIQDLLKFLAMRTGLGAGAMTMAPSEVAPGTYRPNEEVFEHVPDPEDKAIELDPIKVEGSKSAPKKGSGKRATPVLPGRKPPVPGSEAPLEELPVRYIQMTVPIPSDAKDDKIKEFVKTVGGKEWGFRDDYVGEMAGHKGG